MKILIADDHALFRDGLHYVLDELEEQAVILEAANFERATQHASENPDLDLVLLDLNMPGKDGLTVLKTFTKSYPTLPVVILSASDHHKDIQQSLDAGAMGYIPKDMRRTDMLDALRKVLAGHIYAPPDPLAEKRELDSLLL